LSSAKGLNRPPKAAKDTLTRSDATAKERSCPIEELLSFVNRYQGPHAMHLERDTRHTAEEMHSIFAKQEYCGAANTVKAYDQTWFEWLEFTKADGTGNHVTPYTKVYE